MSCTQNSPYNPPALATEKSYPPNHSRSYGLRWVLSGKVGCSKYWGFTNLDAPVKRVGMKYVAAVPHAPILEDIVLPQIDDIAAAVEETLNF